MFRASKRTVSYLGYVALYSLFLNRTPPGAWNGRHLKIICFKPKTKTKAWHMPRTGMALWCGLQWAQRSLWAQGMEGWHQTSSSSSFTSLFPPGASASAQVDPGSLGHGSEEWVWAGHPHPQAVQSHGQDLPQQRRQRHHYQFSFWSHLTPCTWPRSCSRVASTSPETSSSGSTCTPGDSNKLSAAIHDEAGHSRLRVYINN